MTTAERTPALAATSSRRGATGLVDRLAAALDARTSRRGFLARTAVVGSALVVGPGQYLLRPGTAYAAVCGDDSTCSAGYSVFCATINKGVNRCPPNALVGGWWKADNSGFCCGSARYYIDCHSYCSCGCSGTAFCGEGCCSCSCGCGPADSCDQRRVCCNEFRYGQCMQHVSCTGPVWCRVVSCTPPWRVPAWQCTSTPATDNRTGSHTAPGLPYCTAIDQLYTALGGPGSFLGEATSNEHPGAGGGAYTNYDGGSILWSSATGAAELHGAILGTYRAFGAEAGPLGYPTTSERVAADGAGAYNDFLGPAGAGSIYYRSDLGAHPIWGAIRAEWAALGGVKGLGYPTAPEAGSTDGQGSYQTFSGAGGPGSVHWSAATGAHAVFGAIRGRWVQLGGEDGRLGRPVTSELAAPGGGGRYNDFVGAGTPGSPRASVYWSPATSAHSVRGPIRAAWLGVDGAAGRLGYPTSEPVKVGAGKTRSTFQGGFVVYDRATGRTTITYR